VAANTNGEDEYSIVNLSGRLLVPLVVA
jgi:hypothetical protein